MTALATDTSTPAQTQSADPATQLTRIRPTRGWSSEDLRELWKFRELLVTFAVRDIKVRYKQTAVGIIWVIFQPLATALIFAFVFGKVARLGFPGNTPLLLGIFAALTGFNLFKDTFNRSATSLVTNAQLVRKIYFPRILVPLSAAIGAMVDFLVSFSVFIVIWILLGVLSLREASEMNINPPGLQILLAPVCLGLFLMIAMGLGLAATALAASYRDIQYIIPVVLQLALYASPVMYDVSEVSKNTSPAMELLYFSNPLAGLVSVYRWSLIGSTTVAWGAFAWSVVFAIGSAVLGAIVFRRMERRVADVI